MQPLVGIKFAGIARLSYAATFAEENRVHSFL